MKLGAYLFVAGATAAFSFAACGFPAIGYSDAGNTNSSTSTSGGMGGQTSGMGGFGGESGMGGEGGTGPECVYGDVGSCGPGNKCELLDEDAGPAGGVECIPAGMRPDFAACSTSSDCLDGAYCDRFNEVCQRVCAGGDCQPGQMCRPAVGPDQMFAKNVTVCSANCHPISGDPCSLLAGPVNCYDVEDVGWECVKSEGKAEGDPCAGASECGPGMGCFTTGGDFFCRQWCQNPEVGGNMTECGSGSACFKLPLPGAFHNGVEYGLCL